MFTRILKSIFKKTLIAAAFAFALSVDEVPFSPVQTVIAQDGEVPLSLPSGRAFRRVGLHSGNRVRTKFQNDGLVGSKTYIAPLLPTAAWPVDANEYIYDLQVIFGVEREFRDTIVFTNPLDTLKGLRLRDNQPNTTVPSRNNPNVQFIRNITYNGQPAIDISIFGKYVTTQQGPRGGGYRIVNGQFEGLQPVTGFLNPTQESPAMSNIPSSWPDRWPDQPTWFNAATCKAEWNGYFGRNVFNSDQESYYVIDDATDRRWFEEFGFKPRQNDPNRFGAGLQVKARGLQWSSFLAQDNIFFLYEIKNISEFDYSKAVFGSIVGTAVGRQFNRNVSVFDQSRSITYSYNPGGEVDGAWDRRYPVGYVGVAFLESPGNPFDGIDNDDDWNKIGQGPVRISNNGTPDQFRTIPIGNISNTGYDFYEFESDPAKSRGENAPRVLREGDIVITINDTLIRNTDMVAAGYSNFNVVPWRRAVTIPATGKINITSQGRTLSVGVGDTLRERTGNLIDDNLNGVVDEDYKLHFRRTRIQADVLNPNNNQIIALPALRFINYLQLASSNSDLNDPRRFPMIDERRDDGLDNNGNWSFLDDVGRDGRPSTVDLGENDGRPTIGESAFDATDVVESDQIGLTSYKFDLSSLPRMGDSDNLWGITTPGVFDTLDALPKDGDYTYGTGYFPLKRGQAERFSIALVYGQNGREILTNKDIVQEIYDNNYNFTGPPRPEPRLTAVPGDRKVTLYWTSDPEQYFDIFINRRINSGGSDTARSPEAFTFEGYKIYKSTDPAFTDSRLISGGQGEQRFRLAPIAQFDKIDGVTGYFPLVGSSLLEQSRGVSFYLGNETGLTHTFTDTDVDNGRTYYYAVAAYSKGFIPKDTATGQPIYTQAILPAENSIGGFFDSRQRLILNPNTVLVVPKANEAGFRNSNPETAFLQKNTANKGLGRVSYQILNTRKIESAKNLTVEFVDTGSDKIDNNNNGKIDAADPEEIFNSATSFFRVIDNTNSSQPDTLLRQSGINTGSFVRPMSQESSYIKNEVGEFVYRSTDETEMIDKLGLFFTVFNAPQTIFDSTSTWKFLDSPQFSNDTIPIIRSVTPSLVDNVFGTALRVPSDYAIVIKPNSLTDSTRLRVRQGLNTVLANVNPRPTNFFIYDLTNKKRARFFLDPTRGNILGSAVINISILQQDLVNGGRPPLDSLFAWRIQLDLSPRYVPKEGDTLFIRTIKPLVSGDKFTLQLNPNTRNQENISNALENVKVFPNPYIVTNRAEGNLQGADTRGRATRKLFFKNVPLNSTIRIYTIRGELIRTLRADASASATYGVRDREDQQAGTFSYPTSQVEWDLKSSENLDIAYGVYLFHVDAPGVGTKTGKFAVIK